MLRTSICFDSGGCGPILNSGPSFSPGSFRPRFSEAVGAGDAALDRQRPLQLERMCVGDREDLDALPRERLAEVQVGDEDDALLEIPVRSGAERAVVEGHDGAEALTLTFSTGRSSTSPGSYARRRSRT